MGSQPIIFLDDGGVMNDNKQRAAQWQRLVSQYFSPLLGGSPGAWAEANRIVIDLLLEPKNWHKRIQAASDYESFDHHYQLDWLRGMCELVGIPSPAYLLPASHPLHPLLSPISHSQEGIHPLAHWHMHLTAVRHPPLSV